MRRIKKGYPYPMGVTIMEEGINIAATFHNHKKCGMILYSNDSELEERIAFTQEYRIGNIYCILLEGMQPANYTYLFYCDNEVMVDPYARKITGHEVWGKSVDNNTRPMLRCCFTVDSFSWENDQMPQIPFEKCVFYCLHVRGFTKHNTSNVKEKGTYQGIIDKIPYLKELGITSVEILPAYEFDEVDIGNTEPSMSYMMAHYKEDLTVSREEAIKLNYWGFKEGYYFTPKAAYASKGKSPTIEMKQLVQELHRNQMELIMQFYFPPTIRPGFMLEVLRFWILEYHIDGVHLMGENIPVMLIATDPLFGNTKLLYYDFQTEQIYANGEVPIYRNLASCEDSFMIANRKFLKSDEDMLQNFLEHMRYHHIQKGSIHYITNYDGFTLMDLVSYDKKHNEANGENNKDGSNYNYSWNCGFEGNTRKKSVVDLRIRQIKNALVLVILSQGTPFILSGDEFGNSQNGNNNPYCQDNEISWLNWNHLNKYHEIYLFTKNLLKLRREHPILRRSEACKIMDTLSCGYPDISYHGEEVWRPVIDNYNRHIAVMYCGKYEKTEDGKEDAFFYIAYNMHWEMQLFALPNLPKGMGWKEMIVTHEKQEQDDNETVIEANKIMVPPRSITILMSDSKI